MSDGRPVQRETAWRVFANELNSSVVEIKATEEKMPSYLVSPLGAKINRVLIAGTLIEKINSGTDDEPLWRGRVQDVNGQFFLNVGKFQPEAMVAMADLDPPCHVACVGRVRAYTGNDDRIYVSVRPERIVRIEEETLNGWLLEASQSTWARLKWMKRALSDPDLQAADLVAMGVPPAQAESTLYALDSYGEMPDSSVYLKTIQNALRRLLPEMEVDFGFPEGVDNVPDEVDEDSPGTSTPRGDLEDAVLRLLKELDTDGKGAPRDELERRAEAEGISSIDLEEVSNLLMDKGLVYEPNLRYLKLIRRRRTRRTRTPPRRTGPLPGRRASPCGGPPPRGTRRTAS